MAFGAGAHSIVVPFVDRKPVLLLDNYKQQIVNSDKGAVKSVFETEHLGLFKLH